MKVARDGNNFKTAINTDRAAPRQRMYRLVTTLKEREVLATDQNEYEYMHGETAGCGIMTAATDKL